MPLTWKIAPRDARLAVVSGVQFTATPRDKLNQLYAKFVWWISAPRQLGPYICCSTAAEILSFLRRTTVMEESFFVAVVATRTATPVTLILSKHNRSQSGVAATPPHCHINATTAGC